MVVDGNWDDTNSSDQGGIGNNGPDSGSVGEQEALKCHVAACAEELCLHAAVLAVLSEHPPSPPGDSAGDGDKIPDTISQIKNIKITQQFIQEIHSATLDNGGLNPSVVEHLWIPEEELVDISDPDIQLSLDLYLAVTNASEATYKGCRNAILHHYPESAVLSYYSVKKLVSDISGVVSVSDDMCINSCHAFTGPFAYLDTCSICRAPQYDPHQLLLRKNVSLFSRNRRSTHAIWEMKFHDPPVGSGLGPWQERLIWAHGMIHPSEPSSPGWTIGNGSTGHHDYTINIWWTSVMAPATNLTAPAAWTAHMPAGTHVQHYNLTAPQHWQPGPHMPPQHSHSKHINYTKYIMYVVGKEYM